MPKQCEYWYFEECPHSEDCSIKSWKRAKCSGKTPLMAKEALKQHLMRSDFHKFSNLKAEVVARGTNMLSCMMDCDDEEIDEKKVDEEQTTRKKSTRKKSKSSKSSKPTRTKSKTRQSRIRSFCIQIRSGSWTTARIWTS